VKVLRKKDFNSHPLIHFPQVSIMKIAYFDCFSGISGDMVLGAFIDLGLKLKDLKRELKKLKIKGFEIKARKVKRGHIQGTKIDITHKKNFRFPTLKAIFDVIDKSSLDRTTKNLSKDVFTNLAKAEAKVHKQPLNSVHFHQLGELDTIIDIVGCVLAIKLLGIEKIYASRLTVGTGTVNFHKTTFPLPAPATMELIKKRTININPQIKHEVITPTGAAILATLTEEINGSLPMQAEKIGYGAGAHEGAGLSNLLRIIIAQAEKSFASDEIIVIETNIDDTLPQNFEILFERLFSAGALDVYTHSVMMKKMRHGILLHVQTEDKNLEKILDVIFRETTALGVRINRVDRRKLRRKILKLRTDYGIIVRVKIATIDGKIVNTAPEYDDCKRIAESKSLPFKIVYDKIKAQALMGS